ncbi:MAG: hypothetical protein GX620_15125 [Chloroflexi bacterium]|nr:hypothetical protein [Chloroflexota bacterium]
MEREHAVNSQRSTAGGIVQLQARLTSLSVWLGPAVAAACGVIISIGTAGLVAIDWTRLALLLLLVDGGWGTLWFALSSTDWATPFQQWRRWHAGQPVARLPYTLPGTVGDRVSAWLGEFRAWWAVILWPACGPSISAIVVSVPVIALFGLLLGPDLIAISLGAIAIMQLGVAWNQGRGEPVPEWDALVTIMLPWIAGQASFGRVTPGGAAFALLLALAYGTSRRTNSLSGRIAHILVQTACALLLTTLGHPFAALAFVLFLVPQFSLLPWLGHNHSAEWYTRHSRCWLLASMLAIALAL